MITKDIILNIKTKSDFINNWYPMSHITEVAEGSVTDNTYSFNETFSELDVSIQGDKTGYFRIPLGELTVGDKIELEFECQNINSTSSAFLGFYECPKGDLATRFAVQQINNMDIPIGSGYVKKVYGFTVENNTYNNGVLTLGLMGANKGRLKFKNVSIKIKKQMTSNIKTPQIKCGEIYFGASGFVKRNDYSGEDFTITQSDTSTLKITYATPFVGLRPIVSISQDYFSSSFKYDIRVSSKADGFEVKFYKTSDRTNVLLSAVERDVFFGFLAIGDSLDATTY